MDVGRKNNPVGLPCAGFRNSQALEKTRARQQFSDASLPCRAMVGHRADGPEIP